MESRIGLSDWAAGPRERVGALVCALAFVLAALVVTPLGDVALGASDPLFAGLLTASIMAMAITALLLLLQARALGAVPSAVLGTGFLFSALVMLVYALIYPGMYPNLTRALAVSPNANGYLWFTWHAGLLVSVIAFHWLRRGESRHVRRRAAIVIAGLAVAYVVCVPMALWADVLPATFADGRWTPTWLLVLSPSIVALAVAALIATARRRGRATVLDLWLGVVAVAIVVELYLTIVGVSRFTLGWYASRIVVLFATATVLGVLLAQAARMYAALIERAEVLESEAHTDTLTGLPNRRRFDEEFQRAFGSAVRRANPLSIAIIDIDRFKDYNDAFGHQAGDDALRVIAQAIADSVERSGDFASRYGGEEFVVILEDTSLEGALGVAERIRNTVLDTGIHAPAGGILSVSAGVAARIPGTSRDELLRQADAALYEAKNGGRNRVVAWRSAERAPVGSAFDHDPT